MPLAFSPLSEDVLGSAPVKLYPKSAFVMRQIGDPPDVDRRMSTEIEEILRRSGISAMDATSSSGRKDYLERILDLIRGSGFAVAVFSEETRQTALANIALELGFAAMVGKPLVIVKSRTATAPSDLTRTDWIEYDPKDPKTFKDNMKRAVEQIENLAEFENDKLEAALKVRRMDCAVVFERARKAFLLTAREIYIERAETILERLHGVREGEDIDDLNRVREEIGMFVRQARNFLERTETHGRYAAAAPDR